MKKTKILLINFGGLGDQILFFPTIKAVKAAYPDSHIIFATEPRSASVGELTDLIDETIICDIKGGLPAEAEGGALPNHNAVYRRQPRSGNIYKNIIKFLLKVWTQNFDIVVSSGSSQQVAILLFLTGIKTRIGYYSGVLSSLLLTKAVPLNKQQYAVNMYHDLAKALKECSGSLDGHNEDFSKYLKDENSISGLRAEAEGQALPDRNAVNGEQPSKGGGCHPEINVPDEAVNKYREIIKNTDKKVIVIHPGVSKLSIQKNILKFWDVKNWAELVKRLVQTGKYRIILTGGADDREVSSEIKKELGDLLSEDLLDLTEKTSNIIELAAMIKLADLLVCVDSAPMHIGVGVKTRTVALFGPTDEYKLFPVQDPNFIAVTAENLECRPCLWDKRQVSCENPVCLDISVDKVFDIIEFSLKL